MSALTETIRAAKTSSTLILLSLIMVFACDGSTSGHGNSQGVLSANTEYAVEDSALIQRLAGCYDLEYFRVDTALSAMAPPMGILGGARDSLVLAAQQYSGESIRAIGRRGLHGVEIMPPESLIIESRQAPFWAAKGPAHIEIERPYEFGRVVLKMLLRDDDVLGVAERYLDPPQLGVVTMAVRGRRVVCP